MSLAKTPTSSNKKCASRRLSAAFKSPFQKPSTSRKTSDLDNSQDDISALKSRLQEIEAEIETLEKQGFRTEELQVHIDKLHEYNEIKDVGQMVIGRLATLEGVRSQDLYHRYGLNLED